LAVEHPEKASEALPASAQPTGVGLPSAPPRDVEGGGYAPEDEIDLYELFGRLWSQRLLIVAIVLICIMGGVAYLFTATPVYEVTMQIRPGVTGYTKDSPTRGWEIEDIVDWFREGQYRALLTSARATDNPYPRIVAERTRRSNTVTLKLFSPDPGAGKTLLSSLYASMIRFYATEGNDPQIAMTRASLEHSIQDLREQLKMVDTVDAAEAEVEIAELKSRMGLLQGQVGFLREQRKGDEKLLEALRARMEQSLETFQQLLSGHRKSTGPGKEGDVATLVKLGFLQQNAFYLSQLQERITALKKSVLENKEQESQLLNTISELNGQMERLRLKTIQELAKKKQDIQRRITLEKAKIARLAPVEKVTNPLATPQPVKPRRGLILALAAVAGLVLGILVAALRSGYQNRQRGLNRSHP